MMKPVFDAELYNRQTIRLKGYEYFLPGAYFVTILSHKRVSFFGKIEKREIILNDIGQMVKDFWYAIPKSVHNIELDEFAVMPNHLHGIVCILESDGKGEAFSDADPFQGGMRFENASPLRPRGTQSGSLSSIIQNFKSVSTRKVNKRFFKPGNKLWQRNYYERIIRNDRELNAIRQYIIDNPRNWKNDREYPANK